MHTDDGAQALLHLAASIKDITKERERGLVREYLERLERAMDAPPTEPAD